MKQLIPVRVVLRVKVPRAKSSFASPIRAFLLIVLMVAGLTALFLRPGYPGKVSGAGVESSILLVSRLPHVPTRLVYPFSVVAGGVSSPGEALAAARKDLAVKIHYGGIRLERSWMTRNPQPRLVHVSYRKGDRIYWTRNKVRLGAGEQLLTDGTQAIRARCGNRIADKPLGEVEPAKENPDEAIMDTPVLDEEPIDESRAMVDTIPSTIFLEGPGLLFEPEPQLAFSAKPGEPGSWWQMPPLIGGGIPGGHPPVTTPTSPVPTSLDPSVPPSEIPETPVPPNPETPTPSEPSTPPSEIPVTPETPTPQTPKTPDTPKSPNPSTPPSSDRPSTPDTPPPVIPINPPTPPVAPPPVILIPDPKSDEPPQDYHIDPPTDDPPPTNPGDDTEPVPEPSTAALFAIGSGAIYLARTVRRRPLRNR